MQKKIWLVSNKNGHWIWHLKGIRASVYGPYRFKWLAKLDMLLDY